LLARLWLCVRVLLVAIYTITTVELIGGVEKREIKVVPFDPAWPQRFAEERAKIVAALGVRAVRVDHIGSTSIPGLAAKPIIDIQLSVKDVADEEDYLAVLVAIGYHLRVREPGHRLVRTADLGVHVHCCNAGSEWERRHLLFRDWLRYDQVDRVAYGESKNQLAKRDWPDMNSYAEAKSALISEITARAHRWAAGSGWTVDSGVSLT
jgi:GrpB-like predicted nucleotidyltransferase (UPF0157 family)